MSSSNSDNDSGNDSSGSNNDKDNKNNKMNGKDSDKNIGENNNSNIMIKINNRNKKNTRILKNDKDTKLNADNNENDNNENSNNIWYSKEANVNKFDFEVYSQKICPLGYGITKEKGLHDRSIHWVESLQIKCAPAPKLVDTPIDTSSITI